MTTTPEPLDHADLITGGMACAAMSSEMRKAGREVMADGLDLARRACEQLLKGPKTEPAPTMAPLSGTGGATAGYVMGVMPAPHGKAVGQCEGCGGELRHRPDCPKLAPQPPSKPQLKAVP